MFKKLLISLLLSVFLLVSVFPRQALAQTWYNQGFTEWSARVFDQSNPSEIFGERYTYAQVTWIIHSLIAILLGDAILSCISDFDQGNITVFRSCVEALPSLASSETDSSNYATTFSTPVASGVGYVRDTLTRFKIIPEAKAQGFGFETLNPIQTIWRGVRNIAYALMVVAVIITAFMIMFRMKISPQTVITIQSALPKLLITVVLITFSYAIAGLVIDLSYVILGAWAALITSLGTQITNLGTVELFNQLLVSASLPLTAIEIVLLLWVLLVATFGAILGIFVSAGTGSIVVGGLALIIAIIIFIVFFFMAIRILWLMLKTLINIVLLVIGGPVLILLGVFPNAGGISSWLRNLVSNVVIFPLISIMIFLAHYFYWAMAVGPTGITSILLSGWDRVNPYQINTSGLSGSSGGLQLPGFAGVPVELIGFLLSFGILLLVPSVGNMVKELLSGRPFAFGTAIGQSATGWVGPTAKTFGFVSKTGPSVYDRLAALRKRSGTPSGAASPQSGVPGA